MQNENSCDRITRIARGTGGSSIDLQSGSSFFVPNELVDTIGLASDAVIDGDVAEQIAFASRVLAATSKAIDLITRRDHSIVQMRTKLAARGYNHAEINAVCEACRNRGYLDDHRFAVRWIENRVRRRNEAIPRLLAGLSRAGVDRRVAADAIRETVPSNYEDEAFSREIARLEAREHLQAPRIARRLSALGFSAGRIHAHLEKLDENDAAE